MPTEYTTYGHDPLPYDGQQLAMTETAGLFQRVDDRLNRRVIKTGTLGANYTLTEDDLRAGIIELAYTLTANVQIKIPVAAPTRRILKIYNHTTGSFTVTIITDAVGSTGTVITQGYVRDVWHNDLHVYAAGPETAVSASTLGSGIVAFWKLSEASGTRNDSVGSNHLTDNNTVTSIAGKIGDAAVFVAANSEYLSIADNADMSTGDIDFTFAGWFYLATKTAVRTLISKSGGAGSREYVLVYNNGTDRFEWYVSNDGTALPSVVANTFGSPTAATWYYIVVQHDSVNNLIKISVNNGAFNTTAHTTGVFNSTSDFRLGGRDPGQYHDGRIDALGFWKKILSAAEITEDYNGGVGREFPF